MYTFAKQAKQKNYFATSSCRLVWLRRLRTQRKMRDASDSHEKAGPEIYKTNPILGGGIKHFFSPAADFATRPMTSIDARRHWWGATASTCAPVDNSCEAGELAHVGRRRISVVSANHLDCGNEQKTRIAENAECIPNQFATNCSTASSSKSCCPQNRGSNSRAFARWFTKSSRLGRRSKWGVG